MFMFFFGDVVDGAWFQKKGERTEVNHGPQRGILEGKNNGASRATPDCQLTIM